MAAIDAWRLHARDRGKDVDLRGKGFDELVVGQWFHLERMDKRFWWARIGDARIEVHIGKTGQVRVEVERGEYPPADSASDPTS